MRPFASATTLHPPGTAIWVERSEGDPSCQNSKRLPGAEGPPEGDLLRSIVPGGLTEQRLSVAHICGVL